MKAEYDDIGAGYSVTRCTDPKIAKQLYTRLEDASRIVNIGAGSGSYEPENVDLVAVEPSAEMISQRPAGSYRVEQAYAEALPFADASFSHALTVLSMHHWVDRPQAFAEINRVATDRFVAITWDPAADPFWLTRDYFPEIYQLDLEIFPGLDELNEYFDDIEMAPLLIPSDCEDGMLAAFWQRPEAYLEGYVRQSMSSFARLDNLESGLNKLRNDLASGRWQALNQDIIGGSELDVGYRLISGKTSEA